MLGKVSYGGVTTPAGFRAAAANGDIKGKKAERDDCGLIFRLQSFSSICKLWQC